VTDTSFDESFTAIAKGGYVFSHWRGGDGYQCPGSENPVCQVSNTQGAGNAYVEAGVASDDDYGIVEPVFRVLRVPVLSTVDATGKFIGTPINHRDGAKSVYAAVEGSTAAVLLRRYYDHFETEGNMRFTGGGCTGEAYISAGDGGGLLGYGKGPFLYAPDLSAEAIPGDQLSVVSKSNYLGQCGGSSGSPYGDWYPAIAEEFDVTFPLQNVWR
jgi:hypothetical protein